MKKWKRILALSGVALLLLLYISTMVFALRQSPSSLDWFKASVGATVLVPVLLYAMMTVAGHLENRYQRKEPASPVKNVVFDVGRVLLDFDWDAHLKSFGFPPEIEAAVRRATYPSPQWEERDRGALTPEEYLQSFIRREPQAEAQIRQVMARENDSLTLYEYSASWIRYLKHQGYRVYLLSNISESMMEGFRQKLPFLSQVDGAVFSYQVKHIKPEKEIYQILLDNYGLSPKECVFLDDRQENVEAARELGIHAVLFKDFPSAAKELETYGIS